METNSSFEKSFDLLLEYLRDIHHTNLPQLLEADSLKLTLDTFEQFTVFLGDLAPLGIWYEQFKAYLAKLLDWLNRPNWHLAHCLRSIELVRLAEGLGISW